MMPEGVEHLLYSAFAAPLPRVTDSMMPEGVEHTHSRGYSALRAS